MSRVESQSTRTYTVQEGNTMKTITERTVTTADGKTTTYREEKTETVGGSGGLPSSKPALVSNSPTKGGQPVSFSGQ
ncbi:hypothetical protein PoB_000919000 [Plakobranchus ocellatus]|uniref:G5 domain-containing protein n=1 Tax=Plakobranchus ocellatus TaxID=259542 RepID=A0AAV3YHX2_9GAST|nr:hypothetical protein PoB_000919000 [Plakobranchus ocellatus]